MPASFDLADVRSRFPALQVDPEAIHADAPGGTQMVDVSLDAMRDAAIRLNANQHAPFRASAQVDALNDRARQTFGAFLGSEPEGIVFGANMTTLAFHLSHALDELLATGGDIVCTRLDHDANVSPWLGLAERTGSTVRFVDITADGRIDVGSIEKAVTERTKLITFPLASNAFGTIVDPAPFVEAARRVGALTIMDAVHGAPHLTIDRRALGVDVVFCSPYKFFGPHHGVMAADPALLARLSPDKVRPSPDTGAERWQTGTASFEHIAASTAAVFDSLAALFTFFFASFVRVRSAACMSLSRERMSSTMAAFCCPHSFCSDCLAFCSWSPLPAHSFFTMVRMATTSVNRSEPAPLSDAMAPSMSFTDSVIWWISCARE